MIIQTSNYILVGKVLFCKNRIVYYTTKIDDWKKNSKWLSKLLTVEFNIFSRIASRKDVGWLIRIQGLEVRWKRIYKSCIILRASTAHRSICKVWRKRECPHFHLEIPKLPKRVQIYSDEINKFMPIPKYCLPISPNCIR